MQLADLKRIDWRLTVAIIAIILTFFAGSIWRRADVVFDSRAVEIPLSDPLRKSIERALRMRLSQRTKNGQLKLSKPILEAQNLQQI
jgi:hypothetical protein